MVKKALYQQRIKKVVLVLHSQGGIEGGMILDWLLNEAPQDILQKLEVYTFGCFANHFNNPYRDAISSASATAYATGKAASADKIHHRAISHIEHYANSYDYACRVGVLNFTKQMPQDDLRNRFMGRVFVNPRSGHQLNQHYLDTIFPLDPSRRFAREPVEGDFMAMDARTRDEGSGRVQREGPSLSLYATGLTDALEGRSVSAPNEAEMVDVSPTTNFGRAPGSYSKGERATLRMSQLSRLWLYRNGNRPLP